MSGGSGARGRLHPSRDPGPPGQQSLSRVTGQESKGVTPLLTAQHTSSESF